MMNDQKITAPFHAAVRNSLIVLFAAGLRVFFKVITEKKPFDWTSGYLKLILVWALVIIGICFGHAYLGNKIGRLKAGLIVGVIGLITVATVLIKTMS